MTQQFIAGIVGAPFGVKGFVKIHPPSGETDHLLKLQSVVVSKDGKERQLKIEETAPAASAVLIRFAGIDNPEKAKTLAGAQLLVGREQAAPLKEGEYYIEDLKGLPVTTENNETIGHITDIIEGGGGELAEIELSDGEKRLVPFRKDFFPEICPEKGVYPATGACQVTGRIVLQNLWILE